MCHVLNNDLCLRNLFSMKEFAQYNKSTIDSIDLVLLTRSLLANVDNLRQLIEHQTRQSTALNLEAADCDGSDVSKSSSSATGRELVSTSIPSEVKSVYAECRQQQDTALHNCAKVFNSIRLRQQQPVDQPQQQVVGVNMVRYKTELCRQFDENGTCRYGDKCQFAHGRIEIRSVARHPKYKTEMCRTFHSTGFCPYGLRCHFIHNDDEVTQSCAVGSQPTRLNADFTALNLSVSSTMNCCTDVIILDDVTCRQCQAHFKRHQDVGVVFLDEPMLSGISTPRTSPVERKTAVNGRAIRARSGDNEYNNRF